MTSAGGALGWFDPTSSQSLSGYSSISNQFASTPHLTGIDNLGPFSMKKTLYFDIQNVEGGVILSNEEADLHAAGVNVNEAKKDLLDELHIAWREYALCEDDELDSVARDYKRWLLENIEGPEE